MQEIIDNLAANRTRLSILVAAEAHRRAFGISAAITDLCVFVGVRRDAGQRALEKLVGLGLIDLPMPRPGAPSVAYLTGLGFQVIDELTGRAR